MDLISRQEAIDEIKALYEWHDTVTEDRVIDHLMRLPSAQPEPQWILRSEGLPEANGRYLVTRGLAAAGAFWNRVYIANYSDLMGTRSEKIWWQGNNGKLDFERLDDVIAWMPLPEPWQKRREKMVKLKSCPFCGNKNPQIVVDNETETKFGVCCLKCGAHISATFEERDEAEAAWNRRAEPEEEEDE